jgi:hypothetical protein
MTKLIIAVWFSCGAASAVAAKLTLERFAKTHTVRIINNPVDEEPIDNKRFLSDVADWLGVEVEQAINQKLGHTSCVKVWNDRKFMSGPMGAPCTMLLKKEARHQWEAINNPDWHVLGFTADERKRHDRFVLTERSNVIPVLIDAGLTKEDCFDVITSAGLTLPDAYLRGYPNANCIGCVKATSPTYWSHVRNVDPEVFNIRSTQSRDIGARLVRHKGKRIFLDELPEGSTGRKMKSYSMPDCGIFCEEKP